MAALPSPPWLNTFHDLDIGGMVWLDHFTVPASNRPESR